MSSPCPFRHPAQQLVCSVHGDDFATAVAKINLGWLEGLIQAHYEFFVQDRFPLGINGAKDGPIRNRMVRRGNEAIQYETDPRQT